MVLLDGRALTGLTLLRSGKVREVFDLGDELLIVATDRISAFDVVMANGVPDKGRVLNQMSAFWFGHLAAVCPSHVISSDDGAIAARVPAHAAALRGRSTLARKARPLPVECIARGYLSGSFTKSYRAASNGQVLDHALPQGLTEGSRLPEPIFTPATKAESGHDENITFAHAVSLVGQEVADLARQWTLRLYAEAAAYAATRGLILADTKFEFGLTDDGLIWIDEALTPDSSRYWEADAWSPGVVQPSFDKQYLRDYLESSGWNKQAPGPVLPDDVIDATRAKYREAFRRVVGRELDV